MIFTKTNFNTNAKQTTFLQAKQLSTLLTASFWFSHVVFKRSSNIPTAARNYTRDMLKIDTKMVNILIFDIEMLKYCLLKSR